RRVPRPQPQRVLRARGPGGGGLRHAGGGLRGGWPADARRARAHRLPGRRAQPGRLRPLRPRDPHRAVRRPGAVRAGRRAGPRLPVVDRSRPTAAHLRRPDRPRPRRLRLSLRARVAGSVAAMSDPLAPEELDALEARIDAWMAVQKADNPVVAAVERAPEL